MQRRKNMNSIAKKPLYVRRSIAFLLCAFLVLGLTALSVSPGDAAAKYKSPVKIKTNTAKKIDLNGGRKEKVQLVSHKRGTDADGESIVDYTLKIDGKAKKTFKKEPGISGAWTLYYVDLNKKDKYKELVLKVYQNAEQLGYNYYIYRYQKGKLVPIKATATYAPYSYLKKAPCVWGFAMRVYGNGVFKMKYSDDIDGEYKWITLKIDSKMNVKKVK